MKFKVTDIRCKAEKDRIIDGYISYKHKISDEYLDISDAYVDGTYEYIKNRDVYAFYLHVEVELTCPCQISLEPVKVLVDFDTDLFYTYKVDDDDSFEIEGNDIILDEEIWGEIVLHLPVRIVKEGVEFIESEEETLEKENPFSSLGEDKEEE